MIFFHQIYPTKYKYSSLWQGVCYKRRRGNTHNPKPTLPIFFILRLVPSYFSWTRLNILIVTTYLYTYGFAST
ncbi:hypothetical protein HanIR_Chr09g0422711 [Helianthus annuus]|nr:hypothetical protein HanIR_Chr09g0422711 [Helianthus annuus]